MGRAPDSMKATHPAVGATHVLPAILRDNVSGLPTTPALGSFVGQDGHAARSTSRATHALPLQDVCVVATSRCVAATESTASATHRSIATHSTGATHMLPTIRCDGVSGLPAAPARRSINLTGNACVARVLGRSHVVAITVASLNTCAHLRAESYDHHRCAFARWINPFSRIPLRIRFLLHPSWVDMGQGPWTSGHAPPSELPSDPGDRTQTPHRAF